MPDDRVTIRFNEIERAELELYKKTYQIESDGEALKSAVNWVNNYLKNVTNLFFPQSHEVVLIRKKKNNNLDRKVF